MTIYLDQLIITTTLTNFVIIYVTLRLTHAPYRKRNLFSSTALAVIATISLLTPWGRILLYWPAKLLLTLILAYTICPHAAKKLYLQNLLTLILVATIVSGLILFAENFFSSLPANTLFLPKHSFGFSHLLSALMMLIFLQFLYNKKQNAPLPSQTTVHVIFNDRSICAQAIIDTGNHLQDPLSGKPIVLCDYDTFSPLLPAEFLQILSLVSTPEQILLQSRHLPISSRLHLIPYHTIDHESLLLAFRADLLLVRTSQCTKQYPSPIIALTAYPADLSSAARFILPPQLVK